MMTHVEFLDEMHMLARLLHAPEPELTSLLDATLKTGMGAVTVQMIGDGFDTARVRASWWYKPVLVSCDARIMAAVVNRMMEAW